MPGSVTIDGRFDGPLDSGQGGYSAGMLAAFVDGPAAVSLRRPVPLDTPLAVEALSLLDGDAVVADAVVEPLEIEVPEPVAVAAVGLGRGRWRGAPRVRLGRARRCSRPTGSCWQRRGRCSSSRAADVLPTPRDKRHTCAFRLSRDPPRRSARR